MKVYTSMGNDPSLYTPKCGQIQLDNRLKWTRTENCFDKLMEVRNFTRALTECTGDGAYICITSGENGFETLTYDRTSRAASSQLKRCHLVSVESKMSTATCIPRRSPIQVLTWLNVA